MLAEAHPLDGFHQRGRVLKDGSVNARQDGALLAPRNGKSYPESAVDVPVAERHSAHTLPG